MRKNFGAKPFLFPQPVMIIGTYDENGKANAMNAAWGGIAGADEIMIDLSSHKTTDNILLQKAFTVSMGDEEHMTACDYVGLVSANKEEDKMEKASHIVWATGGSLVPENVRESYIQKAIETEEKAGGR